MAKYRKKPVIVEAYHWTGEWNSVPNWIIQYKSPIEMRHVQPDFVTGNLMIPTLEGDHLASFGDWIIQGVKGEIYPCKPDIFEQTYEAVE